MACHLRMWFPPSNNRNYRFRFFFFLSFSIYDHGIHLSNKTYAFWFFNFSFFCAIQRWFLFSFGPFLHVVLCAHLALFYVVLCAHMTIFLCCSLCLFGRFLCYAMCSCGRILCCALWSFNRLLCCALCSFGRILCCALFSFVTWLYSVLCSMLIWPVFFILCSVKSETLATYNVQPRINIFFQRGGRRGWGVKRLGWRDNGPGVGRELKWTFFIVYVLNMYKHDKQTSI